MKDNKTKKQMIAEYKERKITGGVYVIRNTSNGKMLLLSAVDLQGSKNRFDFAKSTGGCVNFQLQADWNKYGGGAFEFEVLEEAEKKPEQTEKEFSGDIELLKEIWQDRLGDADLY